MSRQKNLKRNLLICLLAGSAVMYTLPLHAATSVVANNALPNFDKVMSGTLEKNPDISNNGLTMDITQTSHNAVIKWNSFDVGGSATVNFWGPDNHNTLNYVNSANMSQIYGTINANNNGNIFIVNPAGVQIGPSAQINVGSLYVSNSRLSDDALKAVEANNKNFDFNAYMNNSGTHTYAALMSLGNINANKVTFEGDGRIVIDSERIKDAAGDEKLNYQNINIKTSETNKNNIIIGYEAYDETITNGSVVGYDNKNTDEVIATVTTENGTSQYKKANGYMWVEDVEQLQAIGKNANTLSGNYALRNSIDATSTANWNEVNGTYEGFNPIGLDETGKVIVNNNNEYGFTGNFDGLDYNIFGLTINRESEANVGLFGVAHNANINNVTLVGGSITGGSVVGSVVGAALGNTHITNATNSASVTGNTDVGGIVGYSGDEIDNTENGDISKITTDAHFSNLINTGAVHSNGEQNTNVSNAGGLIGYMYNGTLDGNSYNLGDVSGDGYNVGGLVGHAVNSTIGNPSVVDGKPVENVQVVYNRLDVSGAYNVGGIVGNMEGSTVQNAENSGNVLATEYKTEDYIYHSAEDDGRLNNDKLVDGTFENISNGVYEVTVSTNVANAGGIAGTSSGTSTITNVTNTANVSSNTNDYTQYGSEHEYYTAGNVGGIVGRAEDTDITNATNQENEIRGAHNVGGVAGYLGGNSTVSGGINDGGDIMATGARNENGFVSEVVRPIGNSQEVFIIGNIGGVVGYMDGDNVYVTGSANRGTVHSQDIAAENAANVLDTSKAANVGGIVGKIDRINTKGLDKIKADALQAAVSNSYNTGDVRGYTGVGGVVGMMYNGEVAGSYNLGHLRTTRIATDSSNIEAVNMGGIVGDTTEGTQANAVIYDVYNKGQIGDDTYTYYARHVGGIVGRLSGDISKAYNNGEIYNGYTATGGVVGWMYKGSVNNAFNTGNITVYNHDESTSQVGGIVGAAGTANGEINITNVYNLGTLRSIKANAALVGIENHKIGNNAVGGIIGAVMNKGTVNISGAYTTGNIYAGVQNEQGSMELDTENDMVGSIYGENRGVKNDNTGPMEYADIKRTNTYYIRPEDGVGFTQLGTSVNNKLYGSDNSNKWINYNGRFNKNEYQYDNSTGEGSLSFSSQSADGDVTGNNDDNWRLYPDGTPILNAFLPNSEKYFEQHGLQDDTDKSFNGSIQYGTAYDPLLTIINTNRDLSFDFSSAEDGKLSITNAAGLVVYGGGLTLKDFTTSSGTGYFGGIIYSDGALAINAADGEGLGFGSGSDLYGSSVTLKADGSVTVYGDIVATGNETKTGDNPDEAGSINITSDNGDVNVYGTLTSATAGESVTVPGISAKPDSNWHPVDAGDSVSDPSDSLNTIGERYEHTTTSSNVNGNITITANGKTDKEGNLVSGGNVNLYFGNKGEGITTTGGDLTVTGTGDVFVDSDLDIAGNVTLTSTGKDGEVLLTLTNIGKVQADRFMDVVESAINGVNLNNVSEDELRDTIFNAVNASGVDNSFTEKDAEIVAKYLIGKDTDKVQVLEQLNNDVAVEYMHDFMHSFDKTTDNYIALNAASGNAKLTVDMWVENSDGSGKFDFAKYDSNFTGTGDGHTFIKELEALEFYINEEDVGNNDKIADASKHVYVEVHNGEQLKGIQDYVDSNVENASDALKFNYALMGDINASDVTDYEAIGGTTGFTGTFDGRGNRIIGLDTTKSSTGNGNTLTNAGIFSTVGTTGVVKNVNIYSGNFEGTNTAGAVAGMNSGRIENVTGFGNTVTVTNKNGNAGGIVGVNNGNKGNIITNEDGTITLEPAENERFATGIIDVESIGSVIAKGDNAVAGGLVGTNEGALGNSYSDSAVTSTAGTSAGLGGVVGVNTEDGDVQYVDSLGVTNGGSTGSSNVGGIIGVNNGNMYSGYNESIVSGKDNVGGIIGTNSSAVGNVVNATSVSGKDETDISEYVGGLVGTNSGSVTNGRNNGTITGTNYVGGMVGNNADGSTLTNLVNDSSAAITGVQYVGGIAGKNDGIITANNSNLINRGSITGNQYVGGVAGMNTGEISNTVNSVVLNATGTDAKYFGGVAGYNNGVIGTVTNTSVIDVTAQYGTLVGGIIGFNDAKGTLAGEIVNEGNISGKSEVGGIIGENINQSILNNEGKPRLTISNKGNVRATNGGAAGIFYDNQGVINNVDLINEGTVTGGTAKDSVTGGLFGKNSGKVTNSILTNSGIVTGGGTVGGLIGDNSGSASGSVFTNDGIVEGEDKVGGLFGINSGSFNTSSLINTVNAQVTGKQEVGGLIGKNTGKIEGGRDAADSYYKYQIYNNGTINVTGEGTHIGGLFGTNSGDVEAAYNTGVINAGQSSNVGGIAGVNEQGGKLDQVFNTVMTENGTDAISGGTNVGGLVGTNSGTLSNAYNTTAVNGAEGSTGNAVGVNDEKDAKVNFVYDVTNTKNKLIGKNAGSVNGSYALQESGQVENAANGIAYISVKDKNDKGQYTSLTGSDWKFYDGQQTPLLSVFLTKVKINQDKVNEYMSAHKVYNGTEQKLTANDIKALIDNEAIYVEGLTKEQAFEAFYNNIDLISSVGHTNAGQYSDWLYSQQIASSGSGDTFNPNNLGYDIALTGDINKVKVDIDLNTIERIYGDTTILNNGDYGYSYEFTNADKKYEDVLKNQLKNVLDFAYSEDGALIIVNGEERTNNKGDYTYKGTLTLNSTNFEFVVDKGDSQTETSTSSTLTTYGTSIVHAKKINVDDFLATIVYGNKNNDFVISGIDEVIKDQLAYEEDVLDANLTDIKTIGDYEVIRDGRDTADVGTYDDSITANISINNGNYELTGSAADGTITGNVKVTPVQLDIVLGNVGHEYGSPNLDDYKASIGTNGLVNGDNGNVSIDVNKVVDDALKDNNKYTDNVGDYTWVVNEGGISANGFNLGNYIVTVTNEGKSEVTPAKLDIVLGDVSHKYGSPNLDDYKASIGTNGLVNGDNGNVSIDVNKVVDDALKDNNKYTDNVGDYTWVVSKDGISANGFNLGNYIVTVTNEGKSEVTPAKLNIKVDNANTTVGKMPGELTGTVEGLTNGDTLPAHDFALNDDSLISVSGNHEDVIGIVIGGKFYELGDADWSNGLFANYDVNYEMGDLAVSVVEIPDNWPNNRWDYLFGDNPFDRNENFRERKAEVNFVDGAMEI